MAFCGKFRRIKLAVREYSEVSAMSEATTATITTQELITVSELAAAEIKRLLPEEVGKTGLRLEITGGGCSGMSYGLSFDTEQEKDHVIAEHGVNVYIDPKTAIYVKGTTLDFQGGLEGRGFSIKNPQAKSSCGCGKSFSV
jgi:iron-sulfur cluster assembly protein